MKNLKLFFDSVILFIKDEDEMDFFLNKMDNELSENPKDKKIIQTHKLSKDAQLQI